MDGGRVLNSLLSMKFGSIKGLKISVYISYIFSAIGFLASLYYAKFFMAIIFAFIVVLAWHQRKQIMKQISFIVISLTISGYGKDIKQSY